MAGGVCGGFVEEGALGERGVVVGEGFHEILHEDA